MNTDLSKMNGKETREFMELILDYEMRGSWAYRLWPWLELCGFLWLTGSWYGWKVNRKVRRMLKRPSEMETIVASRPEGGYFK